MRWIGFLFFLLTPSLCFAEQPLVNTAEPTTQQEVSKAASVQDGEKVVRRTRKGKMTAYRFRNDGQ